MKKFMGFLLLSVWLFIVLLMCGEPTFEDTPPIDQPVWVPICFIIIFIGSPFVSFYLMKDKK
jgi:hypothetical protein